MDNTPEQTGYNIEMQSISRQSRINVCTIETHSLWKKKVERVTRIIKLKSKRKTQMNITKKVWWFYGLGSCNIFFKCRQVWVSIPRTLNRKHDIYLNGQNQDYMNWYGFGETIQTIPIQHWYNGYGYHIGQEARQFTGY